MELGALGHLAPATLTKLDLSKCCIRQLHPGFSALSSLHELSLAGNEDVSGLQALTRLAQLSRLDLTGCGLELPDALWIMPALKASFWLGTMTV